MKKIFYEKLRKTSIYILIFIINLLFFSMLWCTNTYGNLNIDELIFHLKVPLSGTGTDFIKSFILEVIIPSIVISIVFLFFAHASFNNKSNKKVALKGNIKDSKINITVFPLIKHSKLLVFILTFIFLIELDMSFKKLNIIEYLIEQSTKSTFINENYVDPSQVKYEFPSNKRNLIYIMVESFENTYFSQELGGSREENLLKPLMPLINDGIMFSNTEKYGGALEISGTGWTVGAMVAQTSGIPLKIPFDGNSYDRYSSFLPGAFSLGEILKNNGYYQEIMFGSKATFAGRDLYYSQHGNYNIWDYSTAVETGKIAEDYFVWWGYEDSKLFDYAKEELIRISNESQPFNFTMLTANTHHIGGYLEEDCESRYLDKYSDVIACTSLQLFNFISWVKQQDFYENTTIIIIGDHLSMDPEYFNDIERSDRTIFNLILNSPINSENKTNRLFSTIDYFPTTLVALDIKLSSNIVGLGVNLFSNEKTLIERYGLETVNNELNKSSKFYNTKILYGNE